MNNGTKYAAEPYPGYDSEIHKRLDDFLPDRIFDAHMHISEFPFNFYERFGFEEYYRDMLPMLCNRETRCNALATPTKELKSDAGHLSTLNFFKEQLDLFPQNTGEILVKPEESAEEIESHLIHKSIRGLKCYHIYASRPDTFNADINEYLPESAFQVADKHGLAITLHMVKDRALSDAENMRQIKHLANKYKNATLILAHAARSFAPWTAIESVEELRDFENVWYDFSGVCESPSMMQILKKIGVSRCMWGSDYNVCAFIGKAVSIGDSFCWLDEQDFARFKTSLPLRPISVGTEGLLAVRQAAMLLDLSRSDIEDLFYNNAARLFS